MFYGKLEKQSIIYYFIKLIINLKTRIQSVVHLVTNVPMGIFRLFYFTIESLNKLHGL